MVAVSRRRRSGMADMGADIDRRRDDVCMQKIVETAKPVGAGWVADTPGPLSAGGSYLISSGW
jgi:hypothetical protein